MVPKVLAPISSKEDVEQLLAAGADEFYCGLMTDEVIKQYTNVLSFNVRHVAKASFRCFGDLKEAVNIAHSQHIPVYVAFNALYMDEQHTLLLKEIDRVLDIGADALMVGDLSLLLILREKYPDTPLHISTMAGTFNPYTAQFYEALGASRIILPRALTLKEIDSIQSGAPGIGFEVFIMSEKCYFINALCHWEHSLYEAEKRFPYQAMEFYKRLTGKRDTPVERPTSNPLIKALQNRMIKKLGPPCFTPYRVHLRDLENKKIKKFRNFCLYPSFEAYRDACGACAIYDLSQMKNIKALKIVGRNHPTIKKLKDTLIIREAVDNLKKSPTRDEFLAGVRDIREYHYPGRCREEFCYYPVGE